MDWAVLLAPVLALAVVLLLGFAGCDFEHGALPPQTPTLTLRARVPTALTVTQVVFRWTPPGGSLTIEALTTPASTDGTDNLYDHAVPEPPAGAWTVNCRATVQPGGPTGEAGAQAMLTLDGSMSFPTATFQASGSPSGGDFMVTYVGVS